MPKRNAQKQTELQKIKPNLNSRNVMGPVEPNFNWISSLQQVVKENNQIDDYIN